MFASSAQSLPFRAERAIPRRPPASSRPRPTRGQAPNPPVSWHFTGARVCRFGMDFVVCALLVDPPKTKETLVALSFEDFGQFLTEELGVESDNLQADTPLFSSGLIDSFSLVTLMSFIENAGEVSIDPSDVTLDNFDSIERIIQFISRKKDESE